MRPYTESFKRKMVQRLLAPGAAPAAHIASETGVHQTTLSRWLREARTLAAVTPPPGSPSTPPSPSVRRPEDWTAEEKLLAVERAGAISGTQLGEFLRREGLHEAQLAEWRRTALEGLRGPAKAARGSGEGKRVRELERQLRRKDKALAEAAALLVLQKKAQALWGDADDDTDPETDR